MLRTLRIAAVLAVAAAAPRAIADAERRLRLVDAEGRPVVLAQVLWTDPSGRRLFGAADRTGPDGSVEAPAGAVRAAWFDTEGTGSVDLADGVTTGIARDPAPWDAEVRDGATGALVPGCAVFAADPSALSAFAGVEAPAPDGRASLPAMGYVSVGGVSFRVRAAPPEGWVGEPAIDVRASVGGDVRRVRTTVVVHREARLTLRVAAAGAEPPAACRAEVEVVGADAVDATAAWRVRCEPGAAAGTFLVRGLPAHPALRVRLVVRVGPAGGEDARAVRTETFAPGTVEEVAVDLAAARPSESVEGPGSGGGLGIGGDGRRKTAPLRVRVLRGDGRPAHVIVDPFSGHARAQRTDADGRATLHLPPGSYTLRVHGAGFLPATRDVVAPAAEEIEIREPKARAFAVDVADRSGRALPFAFVSVTSRGLRVESVSGDTVTAPLRTDVAGRALLPRAPEGELEVSVRLGSASGSANTSDAAAKVVAEMPRE